jgi:hypothetical protein
MALPRYDAVPKQPDFGVKPQTFTGNLNQYC